jgi:hypothetical protein
MFIKKLKEALPYLVKSNVSIFLWGSAGIGKSESPRQWAEEGGHFFKYLNLGTMEVGDLLGLADFEVDSKGNKVSTKFMMPDWARQAIEFAKANPDKYAIIMLDELNRARKDTLQGIFPLVLERRIHTTQFPPNVYVLAAGNPPTDEYTVTDTSDKALVSRFSHVKLNPSTSEWKQFARDNNYDSNILSFIQDQPNLLHVDGQDHSFEDIKPNRRAWSMIDRLIKAGTPADILQELCFGLVGHAATVAFTEHIKNAEKPIDGEEVIKHFSKVADKVKEFSDPETNRNDLITSTTDNVFAYLKKRDEAGEQLTKTEEKNLVKFLKTIPPENSYKIGKEIFLFEKVDVKDLLRNDEEYVSIIEKSRPDFKDIEDPTLNVSKEEAKK